MSAAWPSKTLAEVCEIRPPKSEAKRQLKDSDLVSFVPMEDLEIDQKFLEPNAERKLGQVTGSYTYFADGDVHKYFNPYESPYDSYINLMNVMDNLRSRAKAHGRVREA